jgi:hypothetical protein
MAFKRQTEHDTNKVLTERLVTPELTKRQLTEIPFFLGVAMLFFVLYPPHSSAKVFWALVVLAASALWARWLHIVWERRAPAQPNKSPTSHQWVQFSTMMYHGARASMLIPSSLGFFATSLLTFSYLDMAVAQIALVLSYALAIPFLFAKRYQLLEISVYGIQNKTWRRYRACTMTLGFGLVGIGSAMGMLMSRVAPEQIGLALLGAIGHLLSVAFLAYGVLEIMTFRVFQAKDFQPQTRED